MNAFFQVYQAVRKCCFVLQLIGIGFLILLLMGASNSWYFISSNSDTEQNYTVQDDFAFREFPALNFYPAELKAKCNGQVCKQAAKEILNSLDTSIDPCDNFYDFACEGWSNANPRPDYSPSWSPYEELETESSDLVIDILNEPVNSTSDLPALLQAKDYYRKCMDIEKLENEPDQKNKTMQLIWDTLEEYGGWPILYKDGEWNSSRFSILNSIAALRRLFGYIDIVDIGIYQDSDGNIGNNSIVLMRPTSTSDDVSSDKTDDPEDGTNMAFILNVTRELLQFKGITNMNETSLKRQILYIQWMPFMLKNVHERANNKTLFGFTENYADTTLDVLQNMLDRHELLFPNEMDLTKLLRLLFIDTGIYINGTEEVVVGDLDYYLGVSMLLSETKTEIIANYLHYHMAFQMMLMLPSSELRGYSHKLKYTQDGTTKPVPRSVVCADGVKRRFDFALGEKYAIRRYGNLSMSTENQDFEQTRQLFDNIRDSFSKLITLSTRIDYITTKKLLYRLAAISICPGYPSWIFEKNRVQREYADLKLTGSSYFEQTLELNKWVLLKKLKALQLAGDSDVCKWKSFLDSVSPNYLQGSVYVPVGAIKTPFFDLDLPKSIIYGSFGSSLGHELTHGMIYENDGWTIVNGNRTEMAKCLVDYYSNFTFDELQDKNATLDGENTLDENIPDNVGILAAYNACKEDSAGNFKSERMKGLEKYTDDQLFYIGFAQKWCSSSTLTNMQNSLSNDVHSPGRFRVLGTLRNSKEFAQAWNCPIGSKMNPGSTTTGPKTCTLFWQV